MDLNTWELMAFFMALFAAGFVDSIAGGGGLIAIPAYLALGIPTEFILGTNKCVSSIGTSLSVIRYIKSGKVVWKVTLWAFVSALIGSIIGAFLSKLLSSEGMAGLLVIVTPIVLFVSAKVPHPEEGRLGEVLNFQTIFRAVSIGLLFGTYDGFFGPGTGAFLILAYVTLLQADYAQAGINARIVNFASNFGGFITLAGMGRISFSLALVGVVASLLGNWVGSGLALTHAARIVKPVFHVVLVLLLATSVWKAGFI